MQKMLDQEQEKHKQEKNKMETLYKKALIGTGRQAQKDKKEMENMKTENRELKKEIANMKTAKSQNKQEWTESLLETTRRCEEQISNLKAEHEQEKRTQKRKIDELSSLHSQSASLEKRTSESIEQLEKKTICISQCHEELRGRWVRERNGYEKVDGIKIMTTRRMTEEILANPPPIERAEKNNEAPRRKI